jgi:hypothetical protein
MRTRRPSGPHTPTSRTNDQIIYARRNLIHVRRPDEDGEGVVFFRHAPGSVASLREMNLTIPAGHYDVVGVSSRSGETKALPKWHCGRQVVARNNGESADCGGDRHGLTQGFGCVSRDNHRMICNYIFGAGPESRMSAERRKRPAPRCPIFSVPRAPAAPP